MPFIDAKISVPVSDEKKEAIKTKFGSAITTLGKTESYLMVGIDDGYSLFMAGKPVEKGAYVSVSLYGAASADAYDRMTGQICEILNEELGLSGQEVYVTYHSVNDWGWNGKNF